MLRCNMRRPDYRPTAPEKFVLGFYVSNGPFIFLLKLFTIVIDCYFIIGLVFKPTFA